MDLLDGNERFSSPCICTTLSALLAQHNRQRFDVPEALTPTTLLRPEALLIPLSVPD